MRTLAVPLALSALLAVADAPAGGVPRDILPPAPAGQEWKLAWNDEFDGKVLDASKWDTPEYKRRDAFWSRKAVVLDGKGSLALKVSKEGDNYYDGCARTKGKFEHTFGYYIARMKLQKKAGHWPAFWLYNDSVNSVGNGGMDGTEIDIMEKPWLDDRINYALHWDGYGEAHKSEGTRSAVKGIMEGWHTFSLLWTPESYTFYVDGQVTWTSTAGGVCQVPLYIKLSDEIWFDNWAGDIRKEKMPDETLIDYVRVYDLLDSKTGAPVMKPKPIN
jgi:beta-glucanase (GH16 family)